MFQNRGGWILLEGLVGVSVMVTVLVMGAVFFRDVSMRYRTIVRFDRAVLEAQGEIERAVSVGGLGKKTVVIDATHRLEVILAP